ncbi:MAG: ABC transporter ATP-binding protein [Candidatus Saccharicenans sp.]
MSLLEAEDLTAGYNHLPVLSHLKLRLEAGEFLAICGPNGSGKSTLLKALQRLIPFISGRIRLAGRDLFHLKTKEIAKNIAYVPQISQPVFDFTVEEIVAMARYIHQPAQLKEISSADLAVIEEALELTETLSLRNKRLSQLSGGERQRVLIARAVAQDSPILALDEPSSHLDLNYQLQIYFLLKRLQEKKGKAILVAEHNLNLCVPYCHRLVFLKAGKIEAEGKPEEIISEEMLRRVFKVEVELRSNSSTGLPEISLIHPTGKHREIKTPSSILSRS